MLGNQPPPERDRVYRPSRTSGWGWFSRAAGKQVWVAGGPALQDCPLLRGDRGLELLMTKGLAVVQGPIGVTFLRVTDGLSDGVND